MTNKNLSKTIVRVTERIAKCNIYVAKCVLEKIGR